MKKILPLKISAIIMSVLLLAGTFANVRFRVMEGTPWNLLPVSLEAVTAIVIRPSIELSSSDGYFLIFRIIIYALALLWLAIMLIPKKAAWKRIALICFAALFLADFLFIFKAGVLALLWNLVFMAISVMNVIIEKKSA